MASDHAHKVLIANRGEIACRVIRACRAMGLPSVAVYSDADAHAVHTWMADEAVHVGGENSADSYLRGDRILEAAKRTGATLLHPGYGFLSENPEFREACDAAGVAFVGPSADAMRKMGVKTLARETMLAAGVPVVPGSEGAVADAQTAERVASELGLPVMVKAASGGGGKGMRLVHNADEVGRAFTGCAREAAAYFGDDTIYLEKAIVRPRHVEVQILADRLGHTVHVFDRECSVQRRNQKVIEESPAPHLSDATRKRMGEVAVQAAEAVDYMGAGTVEFLVDPDENFYFLEMNTRLQVEHPVTELITGVDLVEQMIRVANGEPLSITQDDVGINGWAIENRVYAEDPYRNFLPSIGRLTRYRPPAEIAAGPMQDNGKWADDAKTGKNFAVRNDTGVYEGGEISMYYDPMIAKLCTWAPTRDEAVEAMRNALDGFELEGIGHNLPFVAAVMDHPKFISGEMTTAFIEEEYPDGFEGVTLPESALRKIAAATAAMHRVAEIRRARVSGRMDNHERRVGTKWVVTLQGEEFAVKVKADKKGSTIKFADGDKLRVSSDWTPGDQLATLKVGGEKLVLKVGKISGGFRIRSRGADLDVHVRTPRQAELATLMPEKVAPDTSKMLLCPMPGLIVKVDVEVGDTVQEGQALCTVEAMKMENILRAEKTTVVTKINAAAGDSLAVDDVIMEFE